MAYLSAPGLSVMSDRCALRPRTYAALDLLRSGVGVTTWIGDFGPCARKGACDGCPVRDAEVSELRRPDERVLVRVHPASNRPWVMDEPAKGWDSIGTLLSWGELAFLPGWDVGPRHVDEHGEGFWLVARRRHRHRHFHGAWVYGSGKPHVPDGHRVPLRLHCGTRRQVKAVVRALYAEGFVNPQPDGDGVTFKGTVPRARDFLAQFGYSEAALTVEG